MENPGFESVEGLKIRCERQRERANKWSNRFDECDSEKNEIDRMFSELAADYNVARQEILKLRKIIRNLEDLRKSEKAQNEWGMKNQWIEGKKEGRREGILETENSVVYKAGLAALEKKRQEKIERKIEKLIKTYISEGEMVPDWVFNVIRRSLTNWTGMPIFVTNGNKKPTLEGEVGHYTTPSGKTIVYYPNSYPERKVYHCSTQRIYVGLSWIDKNIGKLARMEAERVVK